MEAVAVLSALFWQEVNRLTHVNNMPLLHLLWCATDPSKAQWYFNNYRRRATVNIRERNLFSSGTTSNGSVHAEINGRFRNQPALHVNTLDVQLHVNHTAKLVVHKAALYRPTLRIRSHHTLLCALASNFVLKEVDWASWCQTNVMLRGDAITKCTREALRLRNTPRRITFKRPASEVVRRKPKRVLKRHALNVKPVSYTHLTLPTKRIV